MSACRSISGTAFAISKPIQFSMGRFQRQEEWRTTGSSPRAGGEIIKAACYDVLLTVDQGIPHQQRVGDRKLAVVVLHSPTNQLKDLLPMADRIAQVLAAIRPGQTIDVQSSD